MLSYTVPGNSATNTTRTVQEVIFRNSISGVRLKITQDKWVSNLGLKIEWQYFVTLTKEHKPHHEKKNK